LIRELEVEMRGRLSKHEGVVVSDCFVQKTNRQVKGGAHGGKG